jgi:hypothetical protein
MSLTIFNCKLHELYKYLCQQGRIRMCKTAFEAGYDNKSFSLWTVVLHVSQVIQKLCFTEPGFVNFLRSPRNRFPTWRAGTTTLFDVPARHSPNL